MKDVYKYIIMVVVAALVGFGLAYLLRPTKVIKINDPEKSDKYLLLQKKYDSLSYYVVDLQRSNAILHLERDSFRNEIKMLDDKELKTREYYEKLRIYINNWDSVDITRYFSNRPTQTN